MKKNLFTKNVPVDSEAIIVNEPGYSYTIPKITVIEGKGIQYKDTVNAIQGMPAELAKLQIALDIKFVRGSKIDAQNKIPKQDGVLVEQLLAVCIDRLQSVNVGDLRNRYTSTAITDIEKALAMLSRRTQIRKREKTLGTYNK